MRWVAAASVVMLLAAPSSASSSALADVTAGIRQVQDGDFEGAVATLEQAARELEGRADRVRDLVQAYLYLGVAHVALEQPEQARSSFTKALARDPALRLSPQSFAPKVIDAFEEARRAAPRRRGGGPRVGWILGGAAAGAAAVIVATGGGSEEPAFVNARLATPVIECPDGAEDLPIEFGVLVDARNPGGDPLPIQSVTVVATIVSSPAFPPEVGQASGRPAMVVPATVPAGTNATLRVNSTLLCGNGTGGESRFNDWSVRVTLATTAGVFVLEAPDRMRVNIP
jgi:hypothetical protein